MTVWTKEEEQLLREMFLQGKKRGYMGRTLNKTPGSIAGKVKRMKLYNLRISLVQSALVTLPPIVAPPTVEVKPLVIPEPTPVVEPVVEVVVVEPVAPLPIVEEPEPEDEPDEKLELNGHNGHDLGPRPSPTPPILMKIKDHECKWPIGDPREPNFKFCAEPCAIVTERGKTARKSYCEEHCKVAYVPVRSRYT